MFSTYYLSSFRCSCEALYREAMIQVVGVVVTSRDVSDLQNFSCASRATLPCSAPPFLEILATPLDSILPYYVLHYLSVVM